MDALGRYIDSNVPLCTDDNTTIDDSCRDQPHVEADEYTGFTTRGHVEIIGNEVDVTGAHAYDPKVMERSIDSTGFADFWDGIVFSAAPCETEEETEEQIGRFKAVPVSDEFLIPDHSVVGSTHELRMPSDQDSLPLPLPAKVHHFPKTLSFADPSTYKTISYEQINYGANDDSDISPRRDSSDDSSYYDTVSSTSSTATLLRKVVAVKVDDDDVSDHDDADNTQEEFKFEYTRPEVPKIFIEKVESCHPEPEYAGLMQTSSTGQALLAQSLEQVRKSFEDLSPVLISSKQDLSSSSVPNTAKAEEEKHIARLSKTYLKNLVILSLGFMLCFTAFFSLRNLQSSINHEGGLGLISMSTIYASFMGGCIFAPSIVNKMRPKFALVISMHGLLLFVVSNFYPQYYTLVPASAVLGFSLANLWTAQGTYLTSLAITYAALTNKDHDAILGLFNGFFLFLIQIAQILGNLISSSVFNIELENEELSHLAQGSSIETEPENGSLVYSMGTPLNDTSAEVTQLLLTGSSPKSNMCGVNYCHSYKIDHATEGAQIQPYMLYVLLGVFTAVTLSGILVLGVFLNKLDVIFRRSEVRVAKQLFAIFSLHRDRKLLALVPMLIFLGIEETFMFGEITKAFITCPLGVHMIGYVMVCFGACGAVSAFFFGNLQKYVPRASIICVGAAFNLGVLFGMYFWRPSASEAHVVFLLAGAWGVTDGVWQTQTCSLCGILFTNKRESAFASLRMYESIGFTISAAYAQFLCMDVKMYITGSVLFVSVIGYFVMEGIHEQEKRLKKKSVSFV